MSEFEQSARDQGWKPESEWKGDPPNGGFKTAEQFVKDGEQIPGILKSQIGRLEDRVESLIQTNTEFKQFTDKQRDKDRKENARLISELEATKAEAITNGDGVAAVQAEKDIQNLQPSDPEPDREAYNRLSQQWAADNSWYATNNKLGAFADGIAERIVQQGYTGQAYFNELTRQVKETFPEDFENPNRNGAASVEDGGPREVSGSKAETWANLPADAKAAAKRFEKDMGMSRDDYVASYDWSES